MAPSLVEVTDRRSAQRWVDVPSQIHRGRPGFVPGLRRDAVRELSWRANPFQRHARIRHFMLEDRGRTLGRVAATVFPAYNDRHGKREVFFGFLDAPADPEIVGPLLEACEEVGRQQGMNTVAGPYNYWAGSEFGFLTSNFDVPPAVFQPWSPPGMKELLTGLGYRTRTEVKGYEIALADIGARRDRLARVAKAVATATGVTTRPFDLRRHREEAERLRLLNNAAFAASAEVVPYPPDVFDHMFASLRPLLDPELIRFAVKDGREIGFGLTVPDVNQLLLRWKGRLTPLDLLRLPRDRKRVDAAVVLLLGVLPGSPLGVSQVLFNDTLSALDRGGYTRVHTTWVHQDNRAMNGLLGDAFQVPVTRQWVVMAKDLA